MDKGRCLSSSGLICDSVSAGVLLRNEHASSSTSTAVCKSKHHVHDLPKAWHTSQPIYGPLLKLFEGDLGGRWNHIQVELVRVFLLFVRCIRKLFFLMTDGTLSFLIDAITVMSKHLGELVSGRHFKVIFDYIFP